MEDIKISLAEVTSCAGSIRNLNQRMFESLQSIKREMSSLDGAWMSESGETIRARFMTFANRFENQKELINAYSTFLDFTVSSYDSLETTINSNATSF